MSPCGGLKSAYAPLLTRAIARPLPVIAGAVVLFAGALLLSSRLGQEFIPTLDEKNIAMHALRIPSTSLDASAGHAARGRESDQRVAGGRVRVLEDRHGGDRLRSDAAERFRYLHYPEAAGASGRTPISPKRSWSHEIEQRGRELPGNNYEFTQPIQMRFNELMAGVRGDMAVKVFGDDFEPLLRAANQIAAILRAIDGAADVKVEQIGGLPMLEITSTRRRSRGAASVSRPCRT